MERKIGEIFEYNGEWYQCIVGCYCPDCAFCNNNCEERERITLGNKLTKEETTGFCTPEFREDGKSVIFKKLKKVGGFIITKGRTFQKLTSDNNSCKECVFNVPNKACCKNSYIEGICGDNGFWIEIKQDKEDMEEKKPTYEELLHYYHSTVGLWAIDKNPREVSLDWICDNAFQLGIDEELSNTEKIGKNLKPFDLQAAKSGKPVCTRDGRKARIICWDCNSVVGYPIIALVTEENGFEFGVSYDVNGKANDKDSYDLMMLPEKKEGWVNIDKGGLLDTKSYNTRKEAFDKACPKDYVDTVKINWSE